MNLSRRRFVQACGLAIASTAIGLRLSQGMPEPIERQRTYMMDHTDHFVYGINQDDPFDVLVWERGQEPLEETALSIPEINSKAVWEHLAVNDRLPEPFEDGVYPDTRHLELCASVEISRGWHWRLGPFTVALQDASVPCAQI